MLPALLCSSSQVVLLSLDSEIWSVELPLPAGDEDDGWGHFVALDDEEDVDEEAETDEWGFFVDMEDAEDEASLSLEQGRSEPKFVMASSRKLKGNKTDLVKTTIEWLRSWISCFPAE